MPTLQRSVRIQTPSGPRFALLTSDRTVCELATRQVDGWSLPGGTELQLLSGPPWSTKAAEPITQLSDAARLLPPVLPSKIVCIGKNYRAHAAEMGGEAPKEPLLFFKPPSSVLTAGGKVLLPSLSERVDFEAELAVVIGSHCKNAARERALEHVYGYFAVCDVTARDLQKRDGQWTRAKGFDTFCPIAPEIIADNALPALGIRLTQNEQIRQDGDTDNMVFDVPRLIEAISAVMTLEPGDVIATGTPEGVGPLSRGDAVRIAVGTRIGDSLDEHVVLTFDVE